MPDMTEPWTPGPRKDDMPLNEVVGQALGTASVCWVGGTGDLEFDSTKAAWVLDGLMAHIESAMTETIHRRDEEFDRAVAEAQKADDSLMHEFFALACNGQAFDSMYQQAWQARLEELREQYHDRLKGRPMPAQQFTMNTLPMFPARPLPQSGPVCEHGYAVSRSGNHPNGKPCKPSPCKSGQCTHVRAEDCLAPEDPVVG